MTSRPWSPSAWAALAKRSAPATSEDALPLRLGREVMAAQAQSAGLGLGGLGGFSRNLRLLALVLSRLGLLSLALVTTSLSALSGPPSLASLRLVAFRDRSRGGCGRNLLDSASSAPQTLAHGRASASSCDSVSESTKAPKAEEAFRCRMRRRVPCSRSYHTVTRLGNRFNFAVLLLFLSRHRSHFAVPYAASRIDASSSNEPPSRSF